MTLGALMAAETIGALRTVETVKTIETVKASEKAETDAEPCLIKFMLILRIPGCGLTCLKPAYLEVLNVFLKLVHMLILSFETSYSNICENSAFVTPSKAQCKSLANLRKQMTSYLGKCLAWN